MDHCGHAQYPDVLRAFTSNSIGHIDAASDEPCCAAHDGLKGRQGIVLVGVLTALSGIVVGFGLAGQFTLAGIAYVALILGGVLGWCVRGLAA